MVGKRERKKIVFYRFFLPRIKKRRRREKRENKEVLEATLQLRICHGDLSERKYGCKKRKEKTGLQILALLTKKCKEEKREGIKQSWNQCCRLEFDV